MLLFILANTIHMLICYMKKHFNDTLPKSMAPKSTPSHQILPKIITLKRHVANQIILYITYISLQLLINAKNHQRITTNILAYNIRVIYYNIIVLEATLQIAKNFNSENINIELFLWTSTD